MKDPRWSQNWKEVTDKKNKKTNHFQCMDQLKEYDKKKFLVTEEVKMDWWDKFIGGLKEGRISIWFWIIVLVAMLFTFSISTVKIDFNIDGDIDYRHPKIFQPKDVQ